MLRRHYTIQCARARAAVCHESWRKRRRRLLENAALDTRLGRENDYARKYIFGRTRVVCGPGRLRVAELVYTNDFIFYSSASKQKIIILCALRWNIFYDYRRNEKCMFLREMISIGENVIVVQVCVCIRNMKCTGREMQSNPMYTKRR